MSAPQTHCKHGHEFTPENTGIHKGRGTRFCRACQKLHARLYNEKRTAQRRAMGILPWSRDTFDESYIKLPNGCWEWQRGKHKRYGRYRGRYAHRVSWERAHGSLPADLFVCHKCDNPPCVNPDHLFLGTARDNTDDMVAKGRVNRKLSSKEVVEIRASGADVPALAAKYGVGCEQIYRIRGRRSWRHVS
jgi:hypothetical protein